jgi:superfamily II DNA or RNA helicase
MKLSDFEFKTDYNKAHDDIAQDFYIPCMRSSIKYDRISGYFGSTIYIIAWNSIKDFIKNSGKMRIVCSPYIIEVDRDALSEGYSARSSNEIFSALSTEINDMLANEDISIPSRALACFVAMGVVDVKIAVVRSEVSPEAKRLFHDKVGIFQDDKGNMIGFRGSMNETFKGLSSDGNIESIDVFPNWVDLRDRNRVENAKIYFEKLWENSCPGIDVYDFPQVQKDVFTRYAKSDRWEELVDEVNVKIDLSQKWSADKNLGGRVPRPHQVAALEGWKDNGYRGIFEHATGSGKTFTAMCAIRQSLEKHEVTIILVPSKELLYQWNKEIIEVFLNQAVHIYLCGDVHTNWRKPGYLSAWTQFSDSKKIIISTMDTAANEQFLQAVDQGKHIFLIADEVHRLGSPYRRNILTLNSGPRLGLSATPQRFGDEEGTSVILNYFGGIIQPPFTLNDAIKSGVLTKYFYYPHEIKLSAHEQDEWDLLTIRLSKLIAQKIHPGVKISNIIEESGVKFLLIQRARIIKNAENKVQLAVQIIKDFYEEGQRWIVYCDNQTQLRQVLNSLQLNKYSPYEYHSAMPGDRTETLRFFAANGGILVSIKCLDEGVDIPETTHALILASSKNPREFIQRRGRILRLSPNKPFAVLHDVIVTPNRIEDGQINQLSIINAELARAVQFGEWAENPACIARLRNIAIDFGIDLSEVVNGGFEDDEEE